MPAQPVSLPRSPTYRCLLSGYRMLIFARSGSTFILVEGGAMNRIFRVVWNACMGVWQVRSELGGTQGKAKPDGRTNCGNDPARATLPAQWHPNPHTQPQHRFQRRGT